MESTVANMEIRSPDEVGWSDNIELFTERRILAFSQEGKDFFKARGEGYEYAWTERHREPDQKIIGRV